MCTLALWAEGLHYSRPTGCPCREEAAGSHFWEQKPEPSLGLVEGEVPRIDYSKLVLVPLAYLACFGAACCSGCVQGLMRRQPRSGGNTWFVLCISGLRDTFIKFNLLILQMGLEAWLCGVTSSRCMAEQGLSLSLLSTIWMHGLVALELPSLPVCLSI